MSKLWIGRALYIVDEDVADYIQELEARQPDTELVAALGLDGPWSILSSGKALVLAAEHFQEVHNCDHHGYESVSIAAQMMQKHIDNLERALAQHKASSGSEKP